MNDQIEPDLIDLRHGTEYLMQHPHKHIMYSRKKNFKVNESAHQCFFKVGGAEINKNYRYSNYLQTYCDADNVIDISDRLSVT